MIKSYSKINCSLAPDEENIAEQAFFYRKRGIAQNILKLELCLLHTGLPPMYACHVTCQ